MKNCELCKLPASVYCEADEASLCWYCDGQVHKANFLVARHSRTLLCHLCQSLTPWNASGAKLGPTISVCNPCLQGSNCVDDDEETESVDDKRSETEDEDDSEEEDEDDPEDDDQKEDGEGDNQVLSWSTASTPPPAASPSSSEESGVNRFSQKRVRPNASDLPTQKYGSPLTSREAWSAPDGGVTSGVSTRPLKYRRVEHDMNIRVQVPSWPKSPTVLESTDNIHQRDKSILNRPTEEIDLNSSGSYAIDFEVV